MTGIQSFLQNICVFLNRKSILKRCYRYCAILMLGSAVIAVVSFTAKDFGGKNKIKAISTQVTMQEDEAQEELNEIPIDILPIVEQEDENHIEAAQLEARSMDSVTQGNSEAALSVTNEEYEILTRIVEAEAGTEDVKGKMLVANVVLNRVEYEEFPDNIKDVVFQRSGKRYQFSPIKDGSYYDVTVTDSTRLAVDRVLAGEDESMGALFFCERAISSKSNMKWFDSDLERLFSYGCHEFFVYAQK